MAGYTARRVLQFIPVFIGTTMICWALTWALPGDPFEGRCGQAPCPPSYIAEMTHRFGLDRPLPLQYLSFLKNLLVGDFGENFAGVPIATLMRDAVPISARLAVLAIVIQIAMAAALGIYSGLRPNGVFDLSALVVSLVAFALPTFVVAFLAQYILGIRLNWFAATASPAAPLRELILPAAVLALASMAALMRVLRASVAEGVSADYLRTARAKGLTRRRVIGVHLMRNALVPSLNVVGLELAALLGGTVIVEGIFNINGIGGLVYTSIQNREQLTVATLVALIITVYLTFNLVIDIACALLDPRSRHD